MIDHLHGLLQREKARRVSCGHFADAVTDNSRRTNSELAEIFEYGNFQSENARLSDFYRKLYIKLLSNVLLILYLFLTKLNLLLRIGERLIETTRLLLPEAGNRFS